MKKYIGGVFAVMVAAGLAPLAQATVSISYNYDSGTITGTCTSVGTQDAICNSGLSFTVGDLQITGLSAHANVAGTPTLSISKSSTTDIINNGSVSHTLIISVIADGFTQPVTPPTLDFGSSIGTTSKVVAGNSLTFESCIDQTSPSSGCPATYNQTVLSANVSSATSDHETAPDMTVSLLHAPYSIDQLLDITIAATQDIGFTGQSTLTPVPEPVSIALLGGAVLLTSRLVRRKKVS